MGIGLDYFTYLAELAQKRKFTIGSCLQLGKQDMMFDFEALIGVATRFGFIESKNGKLRVSPDHPLSKIIASHQLLSVNASHRAMGYVSDVAAFAALGFGRVDSLDVDDHEGASVIWDLNRIGLRASLNQTYDFIIDGGTLEHIFHLPNALENVYDVLNVGGYILHANPVNNYVDHGFYQFSPTLFFDFYAANGFEIVEASVTETSVQADSPVFSRRYERTGAALHDFPYIGRLGSDLVDFRFAARKLIKSTGNTIPTQFLYSSASLSGHAALAHAGKVIVWGAGSAAHTIIGRRLDRSAIDFFVDTDERRQGETCLGLPIHAPDVLRQETNRVVLISSVKNENVIRLQISQTFGDHVERIISLNELLTEPLAI